MALYAKWRSLYKILIEWFSINSATRFFYTSSPTNMKIVTVPFSPKFHSPGPLPQVSRCLTVPFSHNQWQDRLVLYSYKEKDEGCYTSCAHFQLKFCQIKKTINWSFQTILTITLIWKIFHLQDMMVQCSNWYLVSVSLSHFCWEAQ